MDISLDQVFDQLPRSLIKIGQKLSRDLKKGHKDVFKCRVKKLMKKLRIHGHCDIYSFISCMPFSWDNAQAFIDLIFIKIFTPRKNILKKREPLESTIAVFLENVKNDPIFQQLDSSFLSLPSDLTYNNLTQYFITKFHELSSILDIPFGYTQNLFLMDDNFLPLFNYPVVFDQVENTFENYKAGKITFEDSYFYSTITQSLVSNSLKSTFIKNVELIVANKLGVPGGYGLRQVLIKTNGDLTQHIIDNPEAEETISTFADTYGINPYVALFIVALVIAAIIIGILCGTKTMNC
jgi:hypothetical protein